jgi:hypothetical protein
MTSFIFYTTITTERCNSNNTPPSPHRHKQTFLLFVLNENSKQPIIKIGLTFLKGRHQQKEPVCHNNKKKMGKKSNSNPDST